MKVDARRKEARSTGKVPFFTSYVKLKLKLDENLDKIGMTYHVYNF